MNSLYDDGKLEESDTNRLNKLNNNVSDSYSKGKINNEQYTNLKKEISVLYEKIYKNRINSLKESPEAYVKRKVLIDKIKDDIEDAYSEGKITELHYNILNERISKMISEDDNHDSS